MITAKQARELAKVPQKNLDVIWQMIEEEALKGNTVLVLDTKYFLSCYEERIIREAGYELKNADENTMKYQQVYGFISWE